jgi:hypothetical protein
MHVTAPSRTRSDIASLARVDLLPAEVAVRDRVIAGLMLPRSCMHRLLIRKCGLGATTGNHAQKPPSYYHAVANPPMLRSRPTNRSSTSTPPLVPNFVRYLAGLRGGRCPADHGVRPPFLIATVLTRLRRFFLEVVTRRSDRG